MTTDAGEAGAAGVEPIVEVRGLRKTFRVSNRAKSGTWSSLKSLFRREYAEVVAVDGIELSIPAGEIRALLGPNGAGKSTTIKILCGVLHPSEGMVRCLGMTPWADRTTFVRHIGAVFGQKSQLLWDLPPIDTFTLNQRIYKIPPAAYRRNLEYFTDTFGLASIMSKPVRNLSLGERMRCELTAALLHEPPLVFLDEPTIGLDILAKDAVRTFVKRVNQERNVTFLLTTHDLDDVEDLCSRITVINHGTIVFDETVDELRNRYVRRKILRVKFSHAIARSDLSRWEVLEFRGVEAALGLDGDEAGYAAQVAGILTALPVQDIEIKAPDIDSIIREVYSRSATDLGACQQVQ